MEQTALRPKPMPGGGTSGGAARPHTGHHRGRRFAAALCGLCAGLVLLLAGVGLGAVGATVIGVSRLAELERQTVGGAGAAPAAPAPVSVPAPAPAGPTLGLAAVDDTGPGARITGVDTSGPGDAAGLVRGDVLLVFGRTRIDSAAGLARAVAGARPGREVALTVRHRGGYRQVRITPGVLT
ncbi:PDZ domain-containing protein [Streptomyces sp. NPDC047017]|uniref:PDZ domain-containing protein n=1 Tax=Streptomyces sp. NPDC047017 TaxID=3155024 RepID=UPI0033E3A9D8